MTAKTERADAIRWIQAQMDDYGLTLDELDAAGCFAPPPPPEPPPPPAPPPPVVCYRNAEGLTWDGQGEMPSWLSRVFIEPHTNCFDAAGRTRKIGGVGYCKVPDNGCEPSS